jgi:hypothetical protein
VVNGDIGRAPPLKPAELINFMIRNFEPTTVFEPEGKRQFQLFAAVGAALIAGLVLLIVPRGSPWSSLTLFAPVVVGRVVPAQFGISLPSTMLLHLAVSVVYGLAISRSVANVTQLRALVTGGAIGLVLYVINFSIVSTWFPELRGNEFSVILTHAVFGMVAGGAYRGLLRRKPAAAAANT